MKKTLLTLFALIALGTTVVKAQNYGGAYLQMSTSAAASGMGQAYTALSGDAASTYWNPAGLASVKNFSFVLLSAQGLQQDRVFNTASFAYRLPMGMTVAASFALSGVKSIDTYSDANVSTGSDDNANTVIGLSAAQSMGSNLSVGGTVRYISQDLIAKKEKGSSIDVGMRYAMDKVTFAAVAQNVVGKVGNDDLPNLLRLGVGMSDAKGLVVGADYVIEDINHGGSNKFANIGGGYNMEFGSMMFTPRAGLQNANFAAGLGLSMKAGSMNIGIDYSYVNENSAIFGANHRVGITLSGD